MRSPLVLFILTTLLLNFSSAFAETTMTFKKALSKALETNEDIQTAKSQLRAADITSTMANFRFLPDFKATATQSEDGTEPNQLNKANGYGLTSNINLFRFGADYYTAKSASLKREAANYQYASTSLELERKIITALLDVIKQEKNLAMLKMFNESKKKNYQVAEKRYQSGILSKQELDKALIDIRNSEALESDTEQEKTVAYDKLSTFIGTATIDSQWPWTNFIKNSNANVLLKQPLAIETHPDWIAAKKIDEAADAFDDQKHAEMYPSLDLSLAYSNNNISGVNVKDWYGGVTLTIPLFNRMQDYGQAQLAREAKVQSNLSLQKTTKALSAQNKIAYSALKSSVDSALLREQTLEISQKLYDDSFKRFQAGRSSVNDLLVDQQRIYQSEQLALQGWYTAHLAITDFCHARGQLTEDCLASLLNVR